MRGENYSDYWLNLRVNKYENMKVKLRFIVLNYFLYRLLISWLVLVYFNCLVNEYVLGWVWLVNVWCYGNESLLD